MSKTVLITREKTMKTKHHIVVTNDVFRFLAEAFYREGHTLQEMGSPENLHEFCIGMVDANINLGPEDGHPERDMIRFMLAKHLRWVIMSFGL